MSCESNEESKENIFLNNIQDAQTLLAIGRREEAKSKIDEMIGLILLGEVVVFGKESIREFIEQVKNP